MVKIRLQGLPDEVDAAAREIGQMPGWRVLAVSEPYQNKGKSLYVRVYADIERIDDSDR